MRAREATGPIRIAATYAVHVLPITAQPMRICTSHQAFGKYVPRKSSFKDRYSQMNIAHAIAHYLRVDFSNVVGTTSLRGRYCAVHPPLASAS